MRAFAAVLAAAFAAATLSGCLQAVGLGSEADLTVVKYASLDIENRDPEGRRVVLSTHYLDQPIDERRRALDANESATLRVGLPAAGNIAIRLGIIGAEQHAEITIASGSCAALSFEGFVENGVTRFGTVSCT